MRIAAISSQIALASIFTTAMVLGQGSIIGVITDKSNSEKIVGANVFIVGTSLGGVSDLDGRFRIQGIPQAAQQVKASCIGYIAQTFAIDFNTRKDAILNIQLLPSVIQGEEVVITAQLRGQMEAINQQISSNAITNVVSQDRIRELPDQNAAEAISRLPGISVERNGGEAQKVVIRGLSPKFNNITINGEKIPSTDLVDRSVDLSSISSDMLAGIEVYKSPTADKDGDAVGGTINFSMKKAPDDPSLDVRFQGGNNSLEKTYGDYKSSLNLSDRFFGSSLGLVLTGSIQKANRSSDGQQEEYVLSSEPSPGSPIPYRIKDMRLVDRKEIRKRYGASAMVDYDFGNQQSVNLTGFWSQTDRDEIRRRERFNIQESRLEYDYQDHLIGTQLFNIGISGNHTINIPIIGGMEFNWRGSNAMSDQNNPFELFGRFFQMGLPGVIADQGPEAVPASVTIDPGNMWLKQIIYASERVTDRSSGFQGDAKGFFRLGNDVSGTLKIGGKYSRKTRDRARTQIISNTVIESDLGPIIYANPSAFYRPFPLTSDVTHKLLMSGFLSNTDAIGSFLGGKYSGWPTIDGQPLHEFWDNLRYWNTPAGLPLFDNAQVQAEAQYGGGENTSYSAGENLVAGYLMSEVNIGSSIMILPGIRYERTKNNYRSAFKKSGASADETPSLVSMQDSTGEGVRENWLPMVQARINPLDGMSLRASIARTISRPNYFDLIPYEIIDRYGSPRSIQKGNPSLAYTRAINYDLYMSVFSHYGLFSVGGFYKTLYDVSYLRTSYLMEGTYKGYQLIQPVNATQASYVYGGELEIQANLTLLPEPFNGIVVSGNLALMKSRTIYPRFLVTNSVIPRPPFLVVTVLDTTREAPMPGQADKMGNVTVGYERGGFSGRISLVFQGRSLAIVGTREEMDGYTNAYYRWDVAMKQRIYEGLSLFLNINNLTGSNEVSSNQLYVTSEQYYGWSAELGLRFKL